MAKTFKDLMEEARREVPEWSIDQVKEHLGNGNDYALLDVREKEEYREGHLAGAISLPRGFLEMRVEQDGARQEHADHRLLRRRHALAARRPHAEGDGLPERRLDERRLQRLEGRRLPLEAGPPVHAPSSSTATAATSCCPRSARRGRRSCSTPRCC